MALDTAFEAAPVEQEPVPPAHQGPGPKDAGKRKAPPLMSKEWPSYHNVYTPETLADRWQCSGNHIRNMIQRGDLAGFQYGGKLLRISAAVVAAYETKNTVK
ncbi:helix-turn-helix domain-containing protein [Methylobacterium sp. E-025]|uniref:helix-turn-helix domain-containing protein n=1 Tax=Methylobacterium sp. E-025 TaxID=2836561 RepID=UPI001FB95FBE|nr:helix-turn-helix domain-containing protein [Methylobacterium sp. E-025]MCJ2109623.1 helix-turn-helix domain-containing protein [Methylobacterium sp. E-025]